MSASSRTLPTGYGRPRIAAPGPARQAQPPYRTVSAALRERIDSGEWLPGEQIPSVRKIAEEYGVSIGTARKALVVLREAGLIVVTPRGVLYPGTSNTLSLIRLAACPSPRLPL